jgi:hypothetical protein
MVFALVHEDIKNGKTGGVGTFVVGDGRVRN